MSKKGTYLDGFNDGQRSMIDARNAAISECERWKREAMAVTWSELPLAASDPAVDARRVGGGK